MRKLVFAAALAILVWAALVVPLPLATVTPVPAQPVADIVAIDGGAVGDLPDDLLFTSVRLQQPTTVGTISILLDADRELVPIPSVVPSGIDPEEFVELQRRQFRESIRAAAAVGLRAADLEVSVSGQGARVVATIPGTPAADVLQQEDVITEVEGETVSLASELAAALADSRAGDEVELTIRRDDELRTVTIEVADISEIGQPGIGVAVTTVDLQIDLPVDVGPTGDANVGGPSAGLMIALAFYDAATNGELTSRRVAGTGAIRLNGDVGPVSGIGEKVEGAIQAGAEVFLVPA
ncbi:MAG: PDZ domain-containing protein, partial [Nitriliruptorales bacterium]|nr:PDZ domain-containing protein [Nitriliruptorales bacterium]